MADFNYHLKNNKILVFFTIFAFLYMSCFTSCSKPKNQEKIEIAQKSGRTEKSEALKTETASNLEAAKPANSTQSNKSDDPCAGCPPGVDTSGENAGQKKPLTQEELNRAADKLDRYFQALEEAVKQIPRDIFDPQAVVDKVGKDPETLFNWVRDNTFLVPYQGVLRSPVGVLVDKMGNSLDRALLLHELLRLAGNEVQLAHGTLSTKQAAEILRKSRPLSQRKSQSLQKINDQEMQSVIEGYVADQGIDTKELGRFISKLMEEQRAFSDKISDRVDEQTSAISKAIGEYQKSAKTESMNPKSEALQDHWWVKMMRDKIWLDLDPTLPGSEVGQFLTGSDKTYKTDELPEDLFHIVRLRVIIEQAAEGKLEEKTVFDYSLKPSALFGQRIILHQVPLNWPKEADLFDNPDPSKSLKLNIINEKEWLPVLSVGTSQITQSSFTDSGEIHKDAKKSSGPGGVGGITGGLFRALGGEEDQKEVALESYLTAEWIEYEICSTGKSAQKMRRPIFDLLGPSARKSMKVSKIEIPDEMKLGRGLAIMRETEILIQVADLSFDIIGYLTAKNMLANREILPRLFREGSSLKKEDLMNELQKITPIPGPEYFLAVLRHSLSRFRDRIYLDHPNIIAFVRGIHENAKGEIRTYSGFDIVLNEISIDLEPDAKAFLMSLYQGILDTNLEGMMMEDLGGQLKNTANIFAESRAQGIEWLTIADRGDAALEKLELPRDPRARIEEDLANGYIVIAPQKEFSSQEKTYVGWWRINPRTGNILGIGENGEGQALSEHILLALHIGSIGICIFHSLEEHNPIKGVIMLVGCFGMIFTTIFSHALIGVDSSVAWLWWSLYVLFEVCEVAAVWERESIY